MLDFEGLSPVFFLWKILFILERERERAHVRTQEQVGGAEGEAYSPLSRGLTRGWIPGLWDHDPSPRQTVNNWATQASPGDNFIKAEVNHKKNYKKTFDT